MFKKNTIFIHKNYLKLNKNHIDISIYELLNNPTKQRFIKKKLISNTLTIILNDQLHIDEPHLKNQLLNCFKKNYITINSLKTSRGKTLYISNKKQSHPALYIIAITSIILSSGLHIKYNQHVMMIQQLKQTYFNIKQLQFKSIQNISPSTTNITTYNHINKLFKLPITIKKLSIKNKNIITIQCYSLYSADYLNQQISTLFNAKTPSISHVAILPKGNLYEIILST